MGYSISNHKISMTTQNLCSQGYISFYDYIKTDINIYLFKKMVQRIIIAIQAINNANVNHRDLHCNNVFCHPQSFNIKIIDFDCAIGWVGDSKDNSKHKLVSAEYYFYSTITPRSLNEHVKSSSSSSSLDSVGNFQQFMKTEPTTKKKKKKSDAESAQQLADKERTTTKNATTSSSSKKKKKKKKKKEKKSSDADVVQENMARYFQEDEDVKSAQQLADKECTRKLPTTPTKESTRKLANTPTKNATTSSPSSSKKKKKKKEKKEKKKEKKKKKKEKKKEKKKKKKKKKKKISKSLKSFLFWNTSLIWNFRKFFRFH